jgi:hypothetical protein
VRKTTLGTLAGDHVSITIIVVVARKQSGEHVVHEYEYIFNSLIADYGLRNEKYKLYDNDMVV